ncbi:TusE/DsrC/DsvC family sulfur relay protein [Enterobacteriaceae endosymbiont of Donacia thalassina]|uniref:TusE/DsrC/DsvC family sulfur relay protein n=1 Tax=Enterobacteriaceae endosymbiont of Donacia thalassina TaxID=2675786 RepID=UPI001448C571|nr:TusE/DsrC/DsvC family sulfur relay protein [Enterobacteriaceae endosymbiont of Donacia thalassina]QJC37148.1 TusE/DsrC/DsvC family sulfur relay protein [Enterobacteriaceae endosymbiont of Donacia thalassina]
MYSYKKKYNLWNKKIAIKIAYSENIILTEKHWKVIYTLRFLYLEYNVYPNLRILINTLKKRYYNIYWDSIILFNLFPKGTIKQASNIAGLPKNNICL